MLSLRRGLSYCDPGDRLVFLDTHADRYFCLDRAAEAEFRRIVSRAEGQDTDSSRMEHLGLLVRSAGGAPPSPCAGPLMASRSLLDTPPATSGLAATMAALARLQEARLRFRLQNLAGALGAFINAKRQSAARPASREDLVEVMAGFVRAERIASTGNSCLSHSYAISRRLLAHQLDANLVLGVRLGPFAAHCWVQHGDWVVNDRLDMVRTFKPILVL